MEGESLEGEGPSPKKILDWMGNSIQWKKRHLYFSQKNNIFALPIKNSIDFLDIFFFHSFLKPFSTPPLFVTFARDSVKWIPSNPCAFLHHYFLKQTGTKENRVM